MIYLVAAIIAGILAIGAVVAMFIFVMPKKKDGKLPKILQILHDVAHFKKFYIGDVLKALYILATAFCLIYGLILLFGVVETYSWYEVRYQSTAGIGLLIMFVGPVAVRISYEFILMFVTLVQNTSDINNKLKNQNPEPPVVNEIPQAPKAPQQPYVNQVPQQPYVNQAPQAPQQPYNNYPYNR